MPSFACKQCPTINVGGVNVTTTSDGGQATNCSCPEGYVRTIVSESTGWTVDGKNYTCQMTATADCGYGVIYTGSYNLYDKFTPDSLLIPLPAQLPNSSEIKKYAGVKLSVVSDKCACPTTVPFTYDSTEYSSMADIYPASGNTFFEGDNPNWRAIYYANTDKKINTKVCCKLISE